MKLGVGRFPEVGAGEFEVLASYRTLPVVETEPTTDFQSLLL